MMMSIETDRFVDEIQLLYHILSIAPNVLCLEQTSPITSTSHISQVTNIKLMSPWRYDTAAVRNQKQESTRKAAKLLLQ